MTHDKSIYTVKDGPYIAEHGREMVRKRHPVYLLRHATAFQVQIREGLMSGNPGDYLAHDPISGEVWPVPASYVEQHYEPFE